MSRTCLCCGMDDPIYEQPANIGDLPQARLVCGLCSRHQGSMEYDLKKRNREHIEMWQVRLEDTRTAAAEALAAARAEHVEKVAELRRLLDERPVQVVYENLDRETVDAAFEARDQAYRTRDRVFRDMTLLHMRHFETDSGDCRCGRPADDCYERSVLDGSRALRGWERFHAERRREGKAHALPLHHPGIIDARWDPDEDVTTEGYGDADFEGGWD